MRDNILAASIQDISNDTKFIRLATVTTFIHSLVFVVYIVYLCSSLINTVQGSDSEFLRLLQEYVTIDFSGNTPVYIIIAAFIVGIGYALLPPIGEAAMIYYLDSEKKQGTLSLSKGTSRFFPMFEFDSAIGFFSVMAILIASSRMIATGIINSFWAQAVLLMRGVVVFFSTLLLPYARMLITLEGQDFFDAIKGSASLAIENLGITFRYVMINFFLYARFIINILIVLGIPLVILYIFSRFGGSMETPWMRTVIILIVVLLFLLTAYINGIIDAFFHTYWYKVYQHIRYGAYDDQTTPLEEEEIDS